MKYKEYNLDLNISRTPVCEKLQAVQREMTPAQKGRLLKLGKLQGYLSKSWLTGCPVLKWDLQSHVTNIFLLLPFAHLQHEKIESPKITPKVKILIKR